MSFTSTKMIEWDTDGFTEYFVLLSKSDLIGAKKQRVKRFTYRIDRCALKASVDLSPKRYPN